MFFFFVYLIAYKIRNYQLFFLRNRGNTHLYLLLQYDLDVHSYSERSLVVFVNVEMATVLTPEQKERLDLLYEVFTKIEKDQIHSLAVEHEFDSKYLLIYYK